MLTDEEKKIIIGQGDYSGQKSMLIDEHILKFNQIIKHYTNFSMQDTILIQRPWNINPVPLDSEYLQILFSGDTNFGHWICIYYKNGVIHVYDSMMTKFLNNDQKIYLNRLFPNNRNLKIAFENVQRQNNPYDCGVFAIAFAISIIYNVCPCGLSFDINKMRSHLLSLFQTFTIKMFPLIQNNYQIITEEISPLRNILHSQQFYCMNLNFHTINFDYLEKQRLDIFRKQQDDLLNFYKKQKNVEISLKMDNNNSTKSTSNVENKKFSPIAKKMKLENIEMQSKNIDNTNFEESYINSKSKYNKTYYEKNKSDVLMKSKISYENQKSKKISDENQKSKKKIIGRN